MMVITREQAGTTLVISLHGKLDTAAAPAVEAEIRKEIVLEFRRSGLSHIRGLPGAADCGEHAGR